MIELKILDIYIPTGLPYTKEQISVTTKVDDDERIFSINRLHSTVFSEEISCFHLSLFHNDLKISSITETFHFLKTSNKYQELDDWVKFEVQVRNANFQPIQVIRIRFSGKYLVAYKKLPTIASIKSLDRVSERSEHYEESSQSDKSMKSIISQPYQREFSCEYLKNISKIEFCYKSIDCAVKRISCYDAIDFYPQDHESGEVVSIPCKLSPSSDLLHISNEREMKFLSQSINLKWKLLELQLEKAKILKKISDTQEDRRDKMKEARRSLKNDFFENIRNVESFIDDLNEQNRSISEFHACLQAKGQELIKERRKLEEEVESLTLEHQSLKKHQKNKSEEVKNSKTKQELLEIWKKSLNKFSDTSKKFNVQAEKLNSDISELINEGKGLEFEVQMLKEENIRLKNLLDLHKQSSDDSEKFEGKVSYFNLGSLEELAKHKKSINQESSDLMKKFSSKTNSLKISGFSIQKSFDSLPVSSKPTKSQKLPVSLKLPDHYFPSSLLSSYISLNSHKKNLNSLEVDLHPSTHSLSLVSSMTEKLLSIQELQNTLYTKIACEISPVSYLENDQIDVALSEFLNKNRSLADFEVQKKSYGVYTVGGRVVHFCEHNGNLVVKSGGGLTPIKSFFIDFKRRSKSLAKS